ncbi:glutathione S-transferase GST-6.0 [Penicillium cosmopolitanum]|uniref:Glutathione S-transferase GST-6.0 n=1 Tax=Penicillium cosmopolitanum TaxID=1131564 RepID=A0A9W9W4W6_9EURO|nr:glutathione S-transferase GST-6.0 [Penicillium cosmopolitanum]KAJ5403554.1 glutathione S-transferase GST-6.0 [Penicillium cosmopolitanum]
MGEITLYYSPGACSLAPHILLQESGLEFSIHKEKTGQFTPALYALNPKGKIPVLALDNNTIITENPAIMNAISNLVPEKGFFGKTPFETVRVYEWLTWLSGTLHGQGFGLLFRFRRYTDDETQFEGLKKRGMAIVTDSFQIIERRLGDEGDANFAVGGVFTAVDAYLFVFHRWALGCEIDMPGLYPRYTALYEAVGGMESTKKAFASEGL